jgi:hypothetical protein
LSLPKFCHFRWVVWKLLRCPANLNGLILQRDFDS